ncbi:hypothetical protein BD779DRAFT_1544439 [Infundibulicybe gibba]|nr:hypothetical protein BD779DRAFT_1544439 [Infundibulicybe gibba]
MKQTIDTATAKRGRACIPCRARKRKCDGATPSATTASAEIRRASANTLVEMKHPGQILEREVTRLERRLHELEHPEDAVPGISLHDPYTPIAHGCVNECSLLVELEDEPASPTQSQLAKVSETITISFLIHAAEYDFFLNIPRFHQSILSPTTSIPRPTRGLMLMLYLYGVHFSRDSRLLEHGDHLLDHALAQATIGVDLNHPFGTVHYLQAEVLLANHLLSIGRLTEARYHIQTAASAYVGWSQRFQQPSDPITADEMIRASQMLSHLYISWIVGLGIPPSASPQGTIQAHQ